MTIPDLSIATLIITVIAFTFDFTDLVLDPLGAGISAYIEWWMNVFVEFLEMGSNPIWYKCWYSDHHKRRFKSQVYNSLFNVLYELIFIFLHTKICNDTACDSFKGKLYLWPTKLDISFMYIDQNKFTNRIDYSIPPRKLSNLSISLSIF